MTSFGQCLCHSITFQIETPTNWMAHCHCTLCQKAHGSAFVTWVGVDKDKVHITDNENCLTWFKSSKDAQRGFCKQCGSTLFFRSKNWAHELHITRANIETAIDRNAKAHAYFESHVAWYDVNDNLQKKYSTN